MTGPEPEETRRSLPEPVTAVTDTAGAWLPARMSEVESGLLAAVQGEGELSDDAVRTLNAGGKRMRPMLVLLCAGPDAVPLKARVNQVLKFDGLERRPAAEAGPGDIVLVTGIDAVAIGTSSCSGRSCRRASFRVNHSHS